MNEKLLRLSELALSDPAIKARFLETRREKDPMDAFCKLACDLGIPLTIGELVGMGGRDELQPAEEHKWRRRHTVRLF